MISQKMKNVADDQIRENREKLIEYVKKNLFSEEEVEIVDNYFEEYSSSDTKNKPVWYLGKSIQKLAEADVLVVEEGAQEARGSAIEILVARSYGIDVQYVTFTIQNCYNNR